MRVKFNKNIGLCLLLIFGSFFTINAQEAFKTQAKSFRENYIKTHDVVKGDQIKYLKFFSIHKKYNVKARFEALDKAVELKIPTSSGKSKDALKIGYIHFKLKGKNHKLSAYQLKSLLASEKYHDYVFVPFTDLTSGVKSYGGGRYLDFKIPALYSDSFVIDFNKAYNPSCIYAEGFNCPIPPRENDLSIKINAGEKIYSLYYNSNSH
jgi:uncharacterized protein (DUF1684 family)